jgi:malate synthase
MTDYQDDIAAIQELKNANGSGWDAIDPESAARMRAQNRFRTGLEIAQYTADKRREAGDGFDGTWVAHPDLIPIAQEEFDAVLGERPNQVDRQRDDVHVTASDLLDLHIGRPITARGVRDNVSVAIRYLEAWLRGLGAVAIDNLMEDAATAEISRSQVWQWIHQDRTTEDGTAITPEYVEGLIRDVVAQATRSAGDRFEDAAEIFREVALREEFPAFLTLGAYSRYLTETD